jgi:hypothetical protein
MKRKLPVAKLSIVQRDFAVSLYDMAADRPRDSLDDSLEMIAKRVVPNALGKSKITAAFKREARKTTLRVGA